MFGGERKRKKGMRWWSGVVEGKEGVLEDRVERVDVGNEGSLKEGF